MTLIPVLVGLTGVLLCFAAIHDVAFRTIPNWLSTLVAMAGLAARSMEGQLLTGFFACSSIFIAALLCWRMGWLGGGDVKLIAACGLVVPPTLAVPMLLDTALAGGVLALLYLALGCVLSAPPAKRPAGLLPRIVRVERYRVTRRGPLPYASAIASGALFVLLKAQ